jgi:two-component system nitrate/nitrite sensor histidine kinase NarX
MKAKSVWIGKIMRHSLRLQMGLVFLGFLLLVAGSVGATVLVVQAQFDDALIINLAGRQRMLTQKMIWLALAQPDSPEMDASIQLFDQTMHALRVGGQVVDANGQLVTLPPAQDAGLRSRLDTVAGAWAVFRARLQPADPPGLQAAAPEILVQLDGLVNAYEMRAQTKVARLQVIQATFLAAALLLLALGVLVVQRRILVPLAVLISAAQAVGAGAAARPELALGEGEFGRLGQAFDGMRVEVAAAREQLETRVTRRTQELVAAFEFSQEIVAHLDLDQLLRSVTERAQTLMRAHSAAVCLLSQNSALLELVASHGAPVAVGGQRQLPTIGLPAAVVGAGQTTVGRIAEPDCASCDFLRAHGSGRCAAAPLRAGGQMLGALCVVREDAQTFDADETRTLTLLANATAIAVANARLVADGQRQAGHTVLLAERARLMAELHDNLAQTMGFLSLKIDQLQAMPLHAESTQADLAQMRVAAQTAYAQVRAALTGLSAPASASASLAEKLAECTAEFRREHSLAVELQVDPAATRALAPVVQTQVLYIVREALTNVRRHACARRVVVRLEHGHDGRLQLEVMDDGVGFDPAAGTDEQHFGLAIMRMRAERSGGTLAIDAAPDAGTRIVAHFPLVEEAVA